jgi:hypothetical protein
MPEFRASSGIKIRLNRTFTTCSAIKSSPLLLKENKKMNLSPAYLQPKPLLQCATRLALALVVGLTCAALPQMALSKEQTPIKIEDVNIEKAVETGFMFTNGGENLKGITKVAIPVFSVETLVKTGQGAVSSDGLASTRLNVTYLLENVSTSLMQISIDRAYDALVADLKAAGIEVVPMEEILNTAAARKLAAAKNPAAFSSSGEDILVYGAKNSPFALNSSIRQYQSLLTGGGGGGANNPISAALAIGQVVGSIAAQVSDGKALQELAEELKVPLLVVQMPVEFISMKAKANSGFGFLSASVEAKLQLMTPSFTRVSISGPTGNSVAFGLKGDVRSYIFPGNPIKEVKDTSSIALNLGLMALSSLAGSKSSSQIKEKTVIADPDQYAESVEAGLRFFSKVLVGKAKKMRE